MEAKSHQNMQNITLPESGFHLAKDPLDEGIKAICLCEFSV